MVTSYTRWLESVQVKVAENQEVCLDLQSAIRAHLAKLESKRRFPEYVAEKPANIGLRSQYALRLESVKDAEGNVIQEAPLPVWANICQRALDTAIAEINRKPDLDIELESLVRSKHRRVTSVTFAIKEQAVPDGD